MNENNFNKPYDTSTTSTTCINGTNYCQYRLPCGYCKILEKRCLINYKDIAYQVPCSKSFMEDVRNHSMKSVNQSRLYFNIVNNKETED